MALSLAANAIITEAQAKGYLQIGGTASDALLTIAIDTISSSFDAQVGYQLIEDTYTAKNMDGLGRNLLRFPIRNVTAISKIESRSNKDTWTELSDSNYAFDAVNGLGAIGVNSYVFIKGRGKWRADFTAGWAQASMPGDILEACLYEVQQFVEKRKAIQSQDTGGQSDSGKTYIDISVNTRRILMGYKRSLL